MRTVRALRGSIYNRIGMLNITLLLSTDDNEGGSLGVIFLVNCIYRGHMNRTTIFFIIYICLMNVWMDSSPRDDSAL